MVSIRGASGTTLSQASPPRVVSVEIGGRLRHELDVELLQNSPSWPGLRISPKHMSKNVRDSGAASGSRTPGADSLLVIMELEGETRRIALNVPIIMLRSARPSTGESVIVEMMLAFGATRHSPVVDEPGHLIAGLSHWELGRFDLYRVNPPLVRLAATFPVSCMQPKIDGSSYSPNPWNRSEFVLGRQFFSQHTSDAMRCRTWLPPGGL